MDQQLCREACSAYVSQISVSKQRLRPVITELRTLHGASHQNIVKYHQAFFDNGAIIIVMEYCDGGSLLDVLRATAKTRPGQGMPEHFVAELARQVVAGLLHLHKGLRVVHRDIKPSNLLLNTRGNCKISDFGVSGQLTNSVANCQSWVGTVTYMSPERINGDEYSFDSDMWSLGLTLVECALGRYPYPPPGQNQPTQPLGFWELLEYIVHEPPPVLSSEDGFSPELCDFVAQCLVKDTKKRPKIEALSKHPFLQMHKDNSNGLTDLLNFAMGEDKEAVRAEAEAENAQAAKDKQ
ncbi:kinase-like domain-containing protein [Dunaliella salina]|uniref:mitogen-activated protein kinase kinase n=1 Tax=Dunaliella salina TaxID=3046 RepID=A0ABQ7H6Q0_DUNSA|nr:kinase-like domain-containing protein [Dunaliella salina]|eukprot:KAF5842541.1 kinase-like domain-containing protein [Dunaliella salina]